MSIHQFPIRPRRPSCFKAEFGAITWITVHGPVRLTEAMAIRLRDILLDGGCPPAFFDLEDALLELSDPTSILKTSLALSLAEVSGGKPIDAA